MHTSKESSKNIEPDTSGATTSSLTQLPRNTGSTILEVTHALRSMRAKLALMGLVHAARMKCFICSTQSTCGASNEPKSNAPPLVPLPAFFAAMRPWRIALPTSALSSSFSSAVISLAPSQSWSSKLLPSPPSPSPSSSSCDFSAYKISNIFLIGMSVNRVS